ncbi:hypothetical protein O181_077051 [Austropuccinia psidii MF-1]|uniref:Uncharacterized protein n=1 Tax=Austropuccinia psidii MF-1 TaxID=1389203 RepID=A0A9Q3FHD6_9BASI|nr:hypothetical protein [Austropuccinia psidii MF-1]
MLGDMARAMLVKGKMPPRFWKYAYVSACFIHNCLPNYHCPRSSPYEDIYGPRPSTTTIYPFGTEAIIHILEPKQAQKMSARGLVCCLLKLLTRSGAWLLWDPEKNCLLQPASIFFPSFQPTGVLATPEQKGAPQRMLNSMTLGEVPKKSLFEKEISEVDYLPPAKDITIPQHLGQALCRPH